MKKWKKNLLPVIFSFPVVALILRSHWTDRSFESPSRTESFHCRRDSEPVEWRCSSSATWLLCRFSFMHTRQHDNTARLWLIAESHDSVSTQTSKTEAALKASFVWGLGWLIQQRSDLIFRSHGQTEEPKKNQTSWKNHSVWVVDRVVVMMMMMMFFLLCK